MKREMKFLMQLVILFIIALIEIVHSSADEKLWSGRLNDGTEITIENLKEILANHELWLSSKGESGKRVEMEQYNLSNAYLFRANLTKAVLLNNNLSNVVLNYADLSNANLIQTNISNAYLWYANLSNTLLHQANLEKADLLNADLSNSKMHYSNLSNAKAWDANLSHSEMISANLCNADLLRANLSNAKLVNANLSKSNLKNANLKKAILLNTNLSEADLTAADLSEANLTGAKLSNAVFEIKPNCLPSIEYIAKAQSLLELTFISSPHALVELREALKKAGIYKLEREITYAIKHTQLMQLIGKEKDTIKKQISVSEVIEAYICLILFEWTSDWGLSPGRPLIILFGFIFIFFIFYAVALRMPKKRDGIWKLWLKDRTRRDIGREEPELLYFRRFHLIIGYGLYFSFLSAFHIGWRDLNLGSWIDRINPEEYTLSGSGWVRFISGLQSIISVYLLALAVLTYFGRPFESF